MIRRGARVGLTIVGSLAFFLAHASAQTDPIGALNTVLVPLRLHANDRLSADHDESRGATPALTVAKHLLRDWIETSLAAFPEKGDVAPFAAQFHTRLRDAALFCDDCFPSYLGYLDDVQVSRENGFLVVRTSAGIWCGFDDSAYVYRFAAGRWQRVWEHEETEYAGGNYRPRLLYAVHISDAGRDGSRLVMTLGSRPGCSVAFQPVYYAVWRIGSTASPPQLILKRDEFANVGEFPPIRGRAQPDNVLVEFTAGGTGYGEGHEAVRHFRLRGDSMEQIDPIAPTPRDFVEEWLNAPWDESRSRSESQALEAWHAKLHRDDGMGDFPEPAQHCVGRPGLWQVGIRLHDVPGEI